MYQALRESDDLPPDLGVRCWTAHLDALSASDLAALGADLDEAERKRAGTFRFARDQQRYIAARGLLRVLLAHALQTSPRAIAFDYSARGKPSLAAPHRATHDLQFNLAHSHGWAMFALAERAVGIDLENGARLGADEEVAALATRVLSAAELATWNTLCDSSARRAAFLRAWVRKEACAKLSGTGMAAELRSFEVALDASARQRAFELCTVGLPSGLTSRWLVRDLAAPKTFFAAVAIAVTT